METASQQIQTSRTHPASSLIVLPMPNGSDVMKMQAMEITSNAPTVAVIKKGNYSAASSSFSAIISRHTSSHAHHASRFLSCRSLPTSLDPLNVTIKWRMDGSPMSSAMLLSLSQISSQYFL